MLQFLIIHKNDWANDGEIAINDLHGFKESAVSVFRGLHPVPDEEVIAMYDGIHVPLENMSDFYGKVNIRRILLTLCFYLVILSYATYTDYYLCSMLLKMTRRVRILKLSAGSQTPLTTRQSCPNQDEWSLLSVPFPHRAPMATP